LYFELLIGASFLVQSEGTELGHRMHQSFPQLHAPQLYSDFSFLYNHLLGSFLELERLSLGERLIMIRPLHKKRFNERQNRQTRGIHQIQLARGTHKMLHLTCLLHALSMVDERALFALELLGWCLEQFADCGAA
jgi:hypothetical protein